MQSQACIDPLSGQVSVSNTNTEVAGLELESHTHKKEDFEAANRHFKSDNYWSSQETTRCKYQLL